METTSKRFLFCIVDASSFIFRAYYAVRPLSNKNGLPTNALFGFINMLIKVLEEFHPSHIAIVYDTKHPSFRKELYPEYKANRGAMPDDLSPQIPYIKKLVETLGLPSFEREGFEADDVIATLADQAAHLSGGEADVCIISSDKDLMQLVDSHIYLYDTMKELKYTAEEVKNKLGVYPGHVADYLGIVGDSSDNIPGVKGIGPKGAVSLLEQFGSLESIFDNIDQIKKETQKKQLMESKEKALLSKKLATVRRDLQMGLDWPSLKCAPNPGESFLALLQELEFHSIAKRIQNIKKSDNTTAAKVSLKTDIDSVEMIEPRLEGDLISKCQPKYFSVQTIDELEKAFSDCKNYPSISIDTETTSLQIHDQALVGFSFCGSLDASYYVPLRHTESNQLRHNQCDSKKAISLFQNFLQGKKIIGQNIKFDLNVLRTAGLTISPDQIAFDSMIASYILEPEARHNLDILSEKYLSHKTIKYSDVCGEGKSEIPFSEVPIDQATSYAAEDAHVAFLLAQELEKKLASVPELKKIFSDIELPLASVIADMEWEGVCVDIPHLKNLSKEFESELSRLEKKAFEVAGQEFNLASPKQLQKILFEDLKLPVIKKTKTGYSTDVEVLEKLRHQHELPAIILETRELAKLKSTYVDVLPELVHPLTGRVHAHFNQTVAATGRLSSSDPNLQNIPIRTESGKKVRQSFIAKKDYILLGADYSQIELRILASMSGDQALCAAFKNKQDIHALTASEIFEVPLAKVSEEERRKAKAINFGILYGKSAFSLAEELDISRAEASDIIKRYFARYPTIREFLDSLINLAKEKSYAETVFGRRRYIEGIHAKNKMILAMAERMAVNTPLQGTAADIIKIAMIDLHSQLRSSSLRAKLILQVHDELVLEVHHEDLEEAKKLVKDCMERAGGSKIMVPLTVGMGVGKNWLEL